jgi:isoprenylcysteine carboxyl methyltransferase (ICMT) family protein YpbQ
MKSTTNTLAIRMSSAMPLLVSAGRPHPAWIVALVMLGWMPMLGRLRAAHSSETASSERWLLGITWALCILLTAASAWDAAHSGARADNRIAAGIALQWVAMAYWSWARTTLGASFAQIGPAAELVMHGPYRSLRHPMYVATVAATLGLAIAGGRPLEFALCATLGLVLAIRALREEIVMRRQLGARWDDYARGSIGFLSPHPSRLPLH